MLQIASLCYKKPGDNASFFTQPKAVSAEGGRRGLNEIHSLIRYGRDRNQVNTCIILSNTIQKDLKFDTANHVAYATYATSWIRG